MKNVVSVLTALLLSLSLLFGKQIDESTARTIGLNFLTGKTQSSALQNATGLELAERISSKMHSVSASPSPIHYYYIFNVVPTAGFVIVAADDVVFPILGYSGEGRFDPAIINPTAAKWLEIYKNQIRHALETGMVPTREIVVAWEELMTTPGFAKPDPNSRLVSPLLQTKWNQTPYVNDLCPYDVRAGAANGYHCVTGCPATAMAQIMKYWNHPKTGTGFHSYNHDTYGTLSANFGGTSYQWASMPNAVNSSNTAVATLMSHCGIAVNMIYGPTVSGAYVIANSPTPEACCEYAYKTYFGYDPASVKGLERSQYTDANWKSILKGELDNSRPIQYAGFGGGSGHTFVCDGYDANDYFHMNWGWGGALDGFFRLDALNPGGGGTGSGTGTYNSYQQAVIGIKPTSGGGTADQTLRLYDYVTASATTIYYGGEFSIHTDILNNTNAPFSGDFGAAVFDAQYNFIDFVEIKSGWTLASGYHYTNGLTFETDGLLSMLPGSYFIAVYSRPSGGNWSIISNYGNYENLVKIDVINPNTIEMFSPMTLTPGSTFTQGQPASVNLDVSNAGNSTFYGTYSVDLYDLNGEWVENIAQITEANGLPAGYHYLSPFLTFSKATVSAEAGTYLLAATFRPNGVDWSLTGSSKFQNPVYVTVQLPDIVPDVYESNNAAAQAYNLPISFNGNAAIIKTQGANCHVGDDFDYYRLSLPSGFNYTITARLQDSYNSNDGKEYTLDAQFTHSTNGSTWSDSYDDILPGNVSVLNGGNLYFFVSPFFLGNTGTYALQINISRTPTTAVEHSGMENRIALYPNPAGDFINVDLGETNAEMPSVVLVNADGTDLLTMEPDEMENPVRIPLRELPAGVYFIHLRFEDNLVTKKFIHRP
jgi:hypothetical protein